MATAIHNLISEDEYLHTSYRPDCDFVDGLLVERNLGQFPHARLQILLAVLLANNERQWNILALVEHLIRLKEKFLSLQTGASRCLRTTFCAAETLKFPAADYLPNSVRHERYLFRAESV